MAVSELIATPLGKQWSFNWILLIELLVCSILTIFFLGYFDRLFATIVSYGIRSYTWRNYHAYIDIQSLQISLLGGRIFFKGVRYHAHNETILVHSGYITWNYWYRKVREAQVFVDTPSGRKGRSGSSSRSQSRSASPGRQERGGVNANKSLPCRLNIQLEGVQAFLYNRSPVYDAIISNINKATEGKDEVSLREEETKGVSSGSDAKEHKPSQFEKLSARIRSSISSPDDPERFQDRAVHDMGADQKTTPTTKPPVPSWLRIFPIHVGCKTAAAVLGNENTKAIITVKVNSASGSFDAGHAGPLDSYKLLFQFEFDHPVINMKPNLDFKELQLATAIHLKTEPAENGINKPGKDETKQRGSWFPLGRKHNGSTDSVRATSFPGKRKFSTTQHPPGVIPGEERWQGLTRYLNEDLHNEHDEWDAVEYARSSTLADCPKMGFTFYWDIPGPVPESVDLLDHESGSYIDDINESAPPEYGMDILVYGGTINYGPWADRQRINFQSIFFPGSYADAIPGKKLLPGEDRVSTEFKLFLSIEQDTVLRIPVRETSKDWKWKGKAETAIAKGKDESNKRKGHRKGKRVPFWKSRNKGKSGPNVRPFAWLDVKVMADTTVNYTMDMVARNSGYRSHVSADVKALEIHTSVNHGLLWRSGTLTLACDLSVPLGWNALREWHFKIINDDLELFILRDHLFLLTDVIADWTSGPPPEYFTFTPFRYLLDVRFRNFKLYLNTNDSNIINDPAEIDKNNFIILHGQELHGDVIVPLEKFRPVRTEIFFDVIGRDLDLQLCLSQTNTVATFVGRENFARLDEVTLKGSHAAFSETSRGLTDRLTFDIHGTKPKIYLFGFVVDRLIKLKENYFGDDLHFRTLDEFQNLSQGKALEAETDAKAQQSNRSNDLDVILCISASDTRALIPANMYSTRESIIIDVPYASADLRITSYYMDLQADFSPMTVSHSALSGADGDEKSSTSRTEIFIESANMSGHRLFGLPPTEPTYVCSWDIDVGKVSGECSSTFFEQAVRSLQCFAFSLDDDENSMPLVQPLVIPDITFLRVRSREIKVWLHIESEGLLVSTGPASIDLNDWSGTTFSNRLKVHVPDFTVACVDSNSASRHRLRERDGEEIQTHAYLRTSLSLSMLKRKVHFAQFRQLQQDHLFEADSRTNRTPFLFLGPNTQARKALQTVERDPPALQYPPIPDPIFIDDNNSLDTGSFVTTQSSSRNSNKNGNSSSTMNSPIYASIPELSRRSSRSSLAVSIRSTKNTSVGMQSNARKAEPGLLRLPGSKPFNDREREKRGLPPSSVAFSSPLAIPYFPLHLITPDSSNLPPLPKSHSQESHTGVATFSTATGRDLDENLDHISLILTVEPGVQLFFTPRAMTAVTNLVDLLQPKTPENLLDAFQINVVGYLLGLEKRKAGAGTSLEISARMPAISARFLNAFDRTDSGGSYQEVDQYDLELTQVALSARHTVHPVADAKDPLSLLHCTLQSIDVSIREIPVRHLGQDLAVQARIHDVLLWLGASNKLSINTSFRDIDVETGSKKIEYLSALVQRTTLLVNDFAARFATLQAEKRERLAYLAYSLTMGGGDTTDPPFLARISHMLRITPHHVRTHDSWKIISRFRYIYQTMSAEEKKALADTSLCPTNATDLVMNTWDQWRSWDLRHVKTSMAMKYLYGTAINSDDSSPTRPTLPLELRLHSSTIRLLIDPGQHQSEIFIGSLTTNVTMSPPSSPSGLMLVQVEGEQPTESVIFQVSSSAVNIRLNWEIIALVESIIGIIETGERLQEINSEPSIMSVNSVLRTDKTWRAIQGIVAIENAAVAFETPNLNAVAESKSLKLSLVNLDKTKTEDGFFLSALLHAATAHSVLSSHDRSLVNATADLPNIYVSHHAPGKLSPNHPEWRIAGTSSNLVLRSREELLGLVETLDLVVRNEVADLKRRFNHLNPSKRLNGTETPITENSRLPKLTVALLMEAYLVDVALLQSLSYSLSGTTGRISVTPSLQSLLSLDVDLDLSSHSHSLHSAASAEPISMLWLPPINAHVEVHQTEERISLTVSTIIQTITLEASAVHGVFSTLNRPEISSTFHAVQADWGTLQQHIQEVFPKSPSSALVPEKTPGPALAYNIALTLAGIKISADAPGKLANAGTAKLSLGLNCVQLQAFNVVAGSTELIPLPEIHTQLRQMFIELVIKDELGERSCGNLALSASVDCTLRSSARRGIKRNYKARVDGFVVNVFAETASAVVDVLNHLQDRLKDVDLSREKRYLRRLRQPSRKSSMLLGDSFLSDTTVASAGFLQSVFSLALHDIQVCWIVGNSVSAYPGHEVEDLVLSIKLIDLATKSENSSQLSIEDVMLQMVPSSQDKWLRSMNSALLPHTSFNVGYASTDDELKMSFQAVSRSVDLLLHSKFMIPASKLQQSIGLAVDKFREATASWEMTPTSTGAQRKNPFGDKRLTSLTVDCDFAGAVVRLQGRGRTRARTSKPDGEQGTHGGRYGQFVGEENLAGAELRTPGIAVKVEYTDDGVDPSLNAELKVDGSSNELTPTVVPLILEISDSIKTVVGETEKAPPTPTKLETKSLQSSSLIDEGLLAADPSQLLGKTSFNLGVRIRRQEFSLSCQPIARVAASAHLEDIYITANTVKSTEHGHFIAVSANFEHLEVSIQHIYSRESTFSFEVESIVLSIMNSKHLSGTPGLSAVLKINPMRTQINARQLQDFLLFREIWIPPEIRKASEPNVSASPEPHDYLVQRYQQVASATAFPWTATVAIAELKVELDLGQAIGKSSLVIEDVWASSRKDSNWEQNLCVGIGKVAIDSSGRMSGFVELAGVRVRTMISWPQHEGGYNQTPLIQASAGFDRLRVKAAFDYQAFAIADIATFDFVMYNTRTDTTSKKDRLVAILDGDKVNVFCTANSASQGLALYQAFERLIQENQAAYKQSLKDVEKFLRRESVVVPTRFGPKVPQDTIHEQNENEKDKLQAPISLYTDVVVTLRSINIGAFPRAFFDSQLFIVEASDVQARFAATLDNGKVHCSLATTLGQLHVALTGVTHPTGPKTLQEITVDKVVHTAVSARGGIILRVPKVTAMMHTWQVPASYDIDYIFSSKFEGKVDVGWNYARIQVIKSMYETHARSLASRLGKPLPESAVKITTATSDSEQKEKGTAESLADAGSGSGKGKGKGEKITAVVNVPQSKFIYHAVEPAVIETPQLRDMGEATPPLEWIGLHRDRLPNVTHQIVIVALLGVAKEVDEAYGRILGTT
ncbi:hypothetical protein EJ08DRAFT_729763 [Tothia fuscella]|uniref:Fermentation associated protein n=1 Tax=Tothia fuscella TaxID=1048955 RepID=A0A9P4P240_9PEZI|nr:hypothetical protein EJ08DRAFT_729763 [Tothia fuscella]